LSALELIGVEGLPEIHEGDRLGGLIASAAALVRNDVVVISQKVVSKAEGRLRALAEVVPGTKATELAQKLGKDPALVELILGESARIVRATDAVLIVETNSGLVCANAGIDSSNVGSEGTVALLPVDPDTSARRLRAEISAAAAIEPLAVVIADSFGRPWRIGQSEVAIGCAGLRPLDDWRGRSDRDGRELAATAIAVADQVAAAADLVRDKAAGVPVVIIRGLGRHVSDRDGPGASALRRDAAEDLFR